MIASGRPRICGSSSSRPYLEGSSRFECIHVADALLQVPEMCDARGQAEQAAVTEALRSSLETDA